jgi:hypothetical protein
MEKVFVLHRERVIVYRAQEAGAITGQQTNSFGVVSACMLMILM